MPDIDVTEIEPYDAVADWLGSYTDLLRVPTEASQKRRLDLRLAYIRSKAVLVAVLSEHGGNIVTRHGVCSLMGDADSGTPFPVWRTLAATQPSQAA
jgi:hypothetical protein